MIPLNLNVTLNPQVNRPAYNSTITNGFFVLNGALYDPDGFPFRIRGLNRAHYDSVSWASGAGTLTGANTARLFFYNIGSTGSYFTASQFIGAISQHTSNGQLCILVANNVPNSSTATIGNTSASDLSTVVTWWVNNYSILSPYMGSIAINVANEWGPPSSNTWKNSYISAVASLRSAGYTCPIVIDTGASGQDPWDILSFAQSVQTSDSLQNCVFSYHAYAGATNLYCTISNIVASGGNSTVTLNNIATTHPFQYQAGNTFTPWGAYYIAGVNGAAINGYQAATGTNNINSTTGGAGNWTVTIQGTYSGYTSGGSIVPYDANAGVCYYDLLFANLAVLVSSNVCVIIGEFGPGQNIGPSPTLTTAAQIVSSCEANGLGWLAWAWDDNNLGGGATSWSGWFGMTLAGPGTYALAAPSGLTAPGMEEILNPRTGLWTLVNPSSLEALWPDPLPNGVVGEPYSFTLTAIGGVPPYTFSVASGTLPSGITLNGSTGVVSGTPLVSANMDAVSFTVTDSGG